MIRSLTFDELVATQSDGAWVIDGRDAADFAAGHLRGSINVGMGGRFAEYAGEVVPAGAPIVLVTEPGHEHEAQIRLARIGFDTVVGCPERSAALVHRASRRDRACVTVVGHRTGRQASTSPGPASNWSMCVGRARWPAA